MDKENYEDQDGYMLRVGNKGENGSSHLSPLLADPLFICLKGSVTDGDSSGREKVGRDTEKNL